MLQAEASLEDAEQTNRRTVASFTSRQQDLADKLNDSMAELDDSRIIVDSLEVKLREKQERLLTREGTLAERDANDAVKDHELNELRRDNAQLAHDCEAQARSLEAAEAGLADFEQKLGRAETQSAVWAEENERYKLVLQEQKEVTFELQRELEEAEFQAQQVSTHEAMFHHLCRSS